MNRKVKGNNGMAIRGRIHPQRLTQKCLWILLDPTKYALRSSSAIRFNIILGGHSWLHVRSIRVSFASSLIFFISSSRIPTRSVFMSSLKLLSLSSASVLILFISFSRLPTRSVFMLPSSVPVGQYYSSWTGIALISLWHHLDMYIWATSRPPRKLKFGMEA